MNFYFTARTKTSHINLEKEVQTFIHHLQRPYLALSLGRKKSPRSRPPQCRFPLRFQTLLKKFFFSYFPQNCPNLIQAEKTLFPLEVDLVLASSYPQNPSSSFGHSFFKIKKEGTPDLLAHGINFSAFIDDGEMFLYTLKGLTGGLSGNFSTLPYYQKIREYVHFESRDLWEFKIQLTTQEQQIFFWHLYELISNQVSFDYYFLTKNCSYQLLWPLQLLRPRDNIVDYYRFYVFPLESIKNIFHYFPLKKIHHRSSLKGEFLHAYQNLSLKEKTSFHHGIKSQATTPLLQTNKAMAKYYQFKKESLKESHLLKIINKQNRENKKKEAPTSIKKNPTFHQSPLYSHDSHHFSFGLEQENQHHSFQASFFMGYHDLLSPSSLGHLEYSSIKLLGFTAHQKKKSIDITPIELVLNTPLSFYEKGLSWSVKSLIRDFKDLQLTTAMGTSFRYLNFLFTHQLEYHQSLISFHQYQSQFNALQLTYFSYKKIKILQETRWDLRSHHFIPEFEISYEIKKNQEIRLKQKKSFLALYYHLYFI